MKLLKKQHNSYSYTMLNKNHLLYFGTYGIKTLQFVRLSNSQFQTIFWVLQKKLKKIEKNNKVKVWCRFTPNLVLTKLNAEARMGKGKGSITETAMFLKPGQVLFELDNLSSYQNQKLYYYLTQKFPGKLKLVCRPTQF